MPVGANERMGQVVLVTHRWRENNGWCFERMTTTKLNLDIVQLSPVEICGDV